MTNQTKTLKVGDSAPDFELPQGNPLGGGATFKLSDYRGKKNVVLAFFPAAFSPVCSQEMPRIQQEKADFNAADALVVGICTDQPFALEAWRQQLRLEYPLLSDFYPHAAVTQAYGLLREEGLAAGMSERAVIGIDKEGIIRYIDVHPILEVPEFAPCLAALKG